ncbi:MAG: hypothetical protein RIQ60_2733 [Pseudomonadota bacterium]
MKMTTFMPKSLLATGLVLLAVSTAHAQGNGTVTTTVTPLQSTATRLAPIPPAGQPAAGVANGGMVAGQGQQAALQPVPPAGGGAMATAAPTTEPQGRASAVSAGSKLDMSASTSATDKAHKPRRQHAKAAAHGSKRGPGDVNVAADAGVSSPKVATAGTAHKKVKKVKKAKKTKSADAGGAADNNKVADAGTKPAKHANKSAGGQKRLIPNDGSRP